MRSGRQKPPLRPALFPILTTHWAWVLSKRPDFPPVHLAHLRSAGRKRKACVGELGAIFVLTTHLIRSSGLLVLRKIFVSQ